MIYSQIKIVTSAHRLPTLLSMLFVNCLLSSFALADNAAEMAKKIQDPLADLAALQVDFNAKFNVGENKDTSYSAIIQPLYTIDTENYNLVTRQLIPALYVPEVTDGNTNYSFELGDIVSSAFISPKTDSDWKWGLGPQVSLKTRTNDQLAAGAGWGGGVTSVATGAAGAWSFATFLSHLWILKVSTVQLLFNL